MTAAVSASILFLLVACGSGATASKEVHNTPTGESSTRATVEDVRARACACKAEDCIEQALAELERERRRLDHTLRAATPTEADEEMVERYAAEQKACAKRFETATATSASAPSRPGGTLEGARLQACACKSEGCVGPARAALHVQRRYHESVLADAKACVDEIPRPEHVAMIIAELRKTRDAICVCADEACVQRAEKELIEWMLKNAEMFKHLAATQADEEVVAKLQEEVQACRARITPPTP